MTATRTFSRRLFLGGSLAAGAVGFTSCTFSSDGPGTAGAGTDDTQTSDRMAFTQMMRPIDHVDPAFIGSTVPDTAWLTAGLMEGLLLLDPDNGNNMLPGVAEKWVMSDDGLTYTFTLRADAMWSNGDAVTADDFVWNWRRSLSPATAKQQENDLAFGGDVYQNIVGAADFFAGKTTDFSTVGVKAKDDHTLEFTLVKPDPLFLPVLAGQTTRPLHPKTVEDHPDDWYAPQNWVSNGPYVLKKWRANAGFTAERNTNYWDKGNYPIATWRGVFNDGGDPAGMVQYNADEIDLFRVNGDPDSILSDDSLADQFHLATLTQFNSLEMLNSENPVLEQDVRVRLALSMAIDREAIAKIAKPLKPATTLCPSGIPGYDEVRSATKFDPAGAKKLLAEAGYANGKGMPTINIMIYDSLPWIEAVGEMWTEHLGIKYKIDQVDVGVLTEKTDQVHPADYVGFRYYHYGIRVPTMYGFASLMPAQQRAMPTAACKRFWEIDADKKLSDSEKIRQKDALMQKNWWPSYRKYAGLVEQARNAADPAKSQQLAVQAASALEETHVDIPILWSGYTFMIKPDVHGLKPTSYMDLLFNLKGVTVGS
jgi:ABC-type oligopeptide transport system substrate-binding subunit